MKRDEFYELGEKWPSSIVARAEVKNFTGGGISPKTIANADSQGIGPKQRILIGRRICYPVPSLVEWLRQNSENKNKETINDK